MSRARYLSALGAAILALATCAGAGATSSWTLRFSFVPINAYQGLPVGISVLVKPRGTRCSIVVRYSDGSRQAGLRPQRATTGSIDWKWTMGQFAPVGPARVSVGCGRSGSLARRFTVVGTTTGHSKLEIVTQGYSQRPDRFGSGSSISYGVLLDNPSTAEDAQNVTVLVNFVDTNDRVLQSSTTRVPAIGAGTTYNLGGSASLPSQTPVAKLEIVVQTGGYVPHAVHIPAVENVEIVPSTFEPDWVGAVDGALINDDQTEVLANAQLSIVLFDQAGDVVGGGTGFLLASLPPGTRAFFSAGGGFSAVPTDRASVAAISIEPTYDTP